MTWETDFQEKIRNVPRCITCKFYNTSSYPKHNGKVAICDCEYSPYYKVGLYTVSCKYYQEEDNKQ